MQNDQFSSLSLSKPILRALIAEGYSNPTPIQLAAIPEVLSGRDLLATAQTGTGKTAAFCLPILQILSPSEPTGEQNIAQDTNTNSKQATSRKPPQRKSIRALILTPTRELALQIDDSLRRYGRFLGLKSVVILGGVPSGSQIRNLRRNPDILVATPGRLLDLMNQGHIHLERTEMLVLDEADRMLDMGFIHDVRRIVGKLPKTRQTLFFSATMSPEIVDLSSSILKSPARVSVSPPSSVSTNIEQKVLFVSQSNKRDLLVEVLKTKEIRRALVFTRTKHGANKIAQQLSRTGISADAIHSNKSQGARQRALSAFDRGVVKVLVATDIVARGIDVEGISHVINYELPNDPESYVHRIGRTARAGAEGIALSFCDVPELSMLKGIEKLTKNPLSVVDDHRFHLIEAANLRERSMVAVNSNNRSRNSGRPGRRSRPRYRVRGRAA